MRSFSVVLADLGLAMWSRISLDIICPQFLECWAYNTKTALRKTHFTVFFLELQSVALSVFIFQVSRDFYRHMKVFVWKDKYSVLINIRFLLKIINNLTKHVISSLLALSCVYMLFKYPHGSPKSSQILP